MVRNPISNKRSFPFLSTHHQVHCTPYFVFFACSPTLRICTAYLHNLILIVHHSNMLELIIDAARKAFTVPPSSSSPTLVLTPSKYHDRLMVIRNLMDKLTPHDLLLKPPKQNQYPSSIISSNISPSYFMTFTPTHVLIANSFLTRFRYFLGRLENIIYGAPKITLVPLHEEPGFTIGLFLFPPKGILLLKYNIIGNLINYSYFYSEDSIA